MTTRLPIAFVDALSKLDHFDREAFLKIHESGDTKASVHMNPGKALMKNSRWYENISSPPFEISARVPWAPDAYYLKSRPSFTLDPLFHAGAYYVQEASGMFLSYAMQQVLNLQEKINVLDLCAAPGGKSTLIQSLISSDSLLVSNEVIKTRIPVLTQNMTKWGRGNGIVTGNDPVYFKQIPGFFDLMVVDAPCSGSGLFRKDPDAASVWTPDLVRLCSQRQQRILADAWDCLKENGYLIYSTCSYSKEENEDILDYIFQNFSCISIPLSPRAEWKIVETRSATAGAFGYRFYPYNLSGEGFFLSVIQKKQTVKTIRMNKITRNPARLHKTVENQISTWIDTGSFRFIPVGDAIHLIPESILPDFELLRSLLYLKKAGIRIGKSGENDWIPDHELALAIHLKDESANLDLTISDALLFLRGEPFETTGGEKGWRVVRYMEKPLGWVKLLGNRTNNYYPKSWRIRKSSAF